MRDCALDKPLQGRPFALIPFTVNGLPIKYTEKLRSHRENVQTLQLKRPQVGIELTTLCEAMMPQHATLVYMYGDSLVRVHIQLTSFS